MGEAPDWRLAGLRRTIVVRPRLLRITTNYDNGFRVGERAELPRPDLRLGRARPLDLGDAGALDAVRRFIEEYGELRPRIRGRPLA